MVDPTIIATRSLLLRPLVALEGVGEVVACVGVRVLGVEVAGLKDVVGVVVGLGVAEERRVGVVVMEEVEVLDGLIPNVVELAVVWLEVALIAAVTPPSSVSVHSTGLWPSFSTMLKSLL